MVEQLPNMGVEEAVSILRQRIGPDGTVALVNLLRCSNSELLDKMDLRFQDFEARIERRFAAMEATMERRSTALEATIDQRFAAVDQRFITVDQRFVSLEARVESLDHRLSNHIDSTLPYAVTFALSLLGVTAAVAAGIAACLS